MKWLHSLNPRLDDTIIVAGDISTNLDILTESFQLLTTKFQHVFFAPGNHELWLTGSKRCNDYNSLCKFFEILNLCDKLGVHTSPAYVGNVLVMPLYSWYKGGDATGGLGHGSAELVKGFDSSCKWPLFIGRGSEDFQAFGSLQPQIAEMFADMNEQAITQLQQHQKSKQPPSFTITFSHFLPHKILYPGMTSLRHIMGCRKIAEQITQCAPNAHVFGHSHLNMDEMIDGIRYVQAALGHQSDHDSRKHLQDHKPTLLWDKSAKGSLADANAVHSETCTSPPQLIQTKNVHLVRPPQQVQESCCNHCLMM